MSMPLYSYDAGTRIWDKAVRGNRPVAMLSTVSGMATAPLFIPMVSVMMLSEDNDKTAGDYALALVGSPIGGFVWMIAYELFGAFDICTLGWSSSEGAVGGDIISNIGEALVKPAYCYYIDGIDNYLERKQKERKRQAQAQYQEPMNEKDNDGNENEKRGENSSSVCD